MLPAQELPNQNSPSRNSSPMADPSGCERRALVRRIRAINHNLDTPQTSTTLESVIADKGVLDECKRDPLFPSLNKHVHKAFHSALRRTLRRQHMLARQKAGDDTRPALLELEAKERELVELDASAGGIDFGYLRFRPRIRQGILERMAELTAFIRTAEAEVLKVEAEIEALDQASDSAE
nr:hypothetical protein CFP56_22526 [Quercus suber]